MAPTQKSPRRAPRSEPLLQASDFTAYLREHAEQIAPRDLRTLLAEAKTLRAGAAQEISRHPRVQRQLDLALQILTDHARGRCPQIPFYTIAVLTVALLYFTDPLDAIPDWIAGIGKTDDALVLELAFAIARPGIERYCHWKDISTAGLLAEPAPAKPKRR
jgi:uncharacterized membrane protein YkvA (DUF1232 family)